MANTVNWKTFLKYLGIGSGGGRRVIANQSDLKTFLNSRASHVAQTALYGYLKTRAGTRFPQLFENPEYSVSINIAKWHVWLACLCDLTVFTGGLIYQRSGAPTQSIGKLMSKTTNDLLNETGVPNDAGPDFEHESEKVKIRIANCDWTSIENDESAFSTSPDALVHWAPVIDEFKQLDGEIVRNSIRFRWIEVRRNLRRNLDASALIESMHH